MKKFKEFFFIYLISGACIMTIASLYGLFSLLLYDQWYRINSIVYSNYFSAHLVYYAFMISIINIPIFLISGIVLLVKRQKIGIAIFILGAAILCIIFGRMIGDSL